MADAGGINVNAICPHGVDTPVARKAIAEAGMEEDWERLMSSSDIATVAVFLANDKSNALHGATSIGAFGLPPLR